MNDFTKVEHRMNIKRLVWPIFIENLFRMVLLNIDILMLSAYSDNAVAAVGLIVQLISFILILYSVVACGSGIAITQFLGAKKKEKAEQITIASIILITLISIIITSILFFTKNIVMDVFKLENDVLRFANEYWNVFSLTSLAFACNICFSSILRSYGYSKLPMFISFFSLSINIIGNYCFLYGPFNIPVLGVTGVAISSAISNTLSSIVMINAIRNKIGIRFSFSKIIRIPIALYKSIFSIGFPTSLEAISFSSSQLVIMKFISLMGTNSLAAYTYTLSISNFVFIIIYSIGSGIQILSGYFVGGMRFDELYRNVNRYFIKGFLISLFLIMIIVVLRSPVASLYTNDANIICIVEKLLIIQVFLETGRVLNLVYISAMKGAGDIAFSVIVGLFSMWGITVLLGWYLGIYIGLGVVGIWICRSLEEWFRGIVMLIRWKKKAWIKF